MKQLPLVLTAALLITSNDLIARGGGGGGGGGFRGGEGGDFRGEMGEGEFREGGVGDGVRGDDGGWGRGGEATARDEYGGWGNEGDYRGNDEGANIDRGGQDNLRVGEGTGEADVNVRPEGDGEDNLNVRTADGRDYDTNVEGPEGYRGGYVWRDGDYVAVNCAPLVPYAAPFGVWAGWNIVTQPDYVQYPVYATYPIETAVQVALQNLGLYEGAIDGDAGSCSSAIEQYQMQNNMPETGTINSGLLTALGIQASAQ